MKPWSVADIADALAQGLARDEARLRDEQAVYGLDALAELRLQPIIAQALGEAGYGVFRERRYPADRAKRRESHGERCDFVLTHDRRELQTPERSGTLFDPSDSVPLREGFWMEVKAAWQHTIEGPNPRYSAQMLSVSRADVGKLAKDPDIVHAGLLLVAFMADEKVAQHDTRAWYERSVERGLPVSFPSTRVIPIVNRIGNGVVALALSPVNHL